MGGGNPSMIPFGQLGKVKLGTGVLGKTGAVSLGLLAVYATAILAMRNQDPVVVGVMAALLVLSTVYVAYFTIKAFGYAKSHPDHAVMEGANLVRMTEIQQAARDPKTINGNALPVPNDRAPVSILPPPPSTKPKGIESKRRPPNA
jgi:hypothetical protein